MAALHNDNNRMLVNSLKTWNYWDLDPEVTLFETIAHRIWSFDLSSLFCGNLYNGVRIFLKLELNISFLYVLQLLKKKKASQKNETTPGNDQNCSRDMGIPFILLLGLGRTFRKWKELMTSQKQRTPVYSSSRKRVSSL